LVVAKEGRDVEKGTIGRGHLVVGKGVMMERGERGMIGCEHC
jgi:hypothetical protein